MKTIENKSTTIAKSETEKATYADLLTTLLNRPVSKAIDLNSMRKDLRLLDTLEASQDTIELSEEDFTYIAKLVDESEWAIKHKDIVAFADYIDSLKS